VERPLVEEIGVADGYHCHTHVHDGTAPNARLRSDIPLSYGGQVEDVGAQIHAGPRGEVRAEGADEHRCPEP
jgi:hypothetical protein